MMLLFIILILALLIPDAYILFFMLVARPWWLKALFLLPTAVYCLALIAFPLLSGARQQMMNIVFWLTLCVVFPTAMFALVSAIGRCAGLLRDSLAFVFDIAAVFAALLWLGVSLYGCIAGWKRLTVDTQEIASAKIPEAFDGYRIVQLSDFHIGTYASSPEAVDRITERVNSLKPDLILFTGDLVNISVSELDGFKQVLGRLRASDGVYSVLGNHDYCLYREYTAPDSPEKELARLIACEEEIGWRLLRNESVRIVRGEWSIAVAGVDNAGSRMFPDKSDLTKALDGLSPDEFKILLSHDPSHWRREVLPKSDVDLMLAGHTHAMQFKIGGWSPSKWMYPEWGGLYREDERALYVSTGTGGNVAFRFGAWPQISLITLRSQF